MTIINDDSWVVNKLEASLTDGARIVIYDCHMFIVQATGHSAHFPNDDCKKFVSHFVNIILHVFMMKILWLISWLTGIFPKSI